MLLHHLLEPGLEFIQWRSNAFAVTLNSLAMHHQLRCGIRKKFHQLARVAGEIVLAKAKFTCLPVAAYASHGSSATKTLYSCAKNTASYSG